MRRRWLLLTVLSFVALAVLCVAWGQTVKWVGGKTLRVEVLAIDTDALAPVAGAKVTVFEGPQSPLEGNISWRKLSDFEPDEESPDTKSATTGDDGRCTVTYRFWAAGSDGPFDHSGYVDTSRAWLRVSSPDRPTALVPLDRQSVRPRDLNDVTPLVVTVVTNKK